MGEVFVIHVQYSMSITLYHPFSFLFFVMLGSYPCIMCEKSENFNLFTKLCNIRVILFFYFNSWSTVVRMINLLMSPFFDNQCSFLTSLMMPNTEVERKKSNFWNTTILTTLYKKYRELIYLYIIYLAFF